MGEDSDANADHRTVGGGGSDSVVSKFEMKFKIHARRNAHLSTYTVCTCVWTINALTGCRFET